MLTKEQLLTELRKLSIAEIRDIIAILQGRVDFYKEHISFDPVVGLGIRL